MRPSQRYPEACTGGWGLLIEDDTLLQQDRGETFALATISHK